MRIMIQAFIGMNTTKFLFALCYKKHNLYVGKGFVIKIAQYVCIVCYILNWIEFVDIADQLNTYKE